ncbi:MAG: hypothetical protein V4671_16830 [Armatimonadota bacterium]
MSRRAWLALALGGAAVWFGVRLGPRFDHFEGQGPTPSKALYAAHMAVTKAVEAKGGRIVHFDRGGAANQTAPDRWQASGTATAEMPDRDKPQRINFETVQQWTPETRTFRLSGISITRDAKAPKGRD